MVGAGILTAIAAQALTRDTTPSLIATVLLAIGAALAARPAVHAAVLAAPGRGRLFAARDPGRWAVTTRFAAASLAQSPRRAALTVAMMAVGLASVLWLGMLAHSVERSVVSALMPAMRADLVVGSSHVASGFLEAPVDDGVIGELRAMPEVAAAVGDRVVEWHHDGGPIAIDAFDPSYFTTPELGRWPLADGGSPALWDAIARGEAVLVSTSFASNLGVRVDAVLTLDTPSGPWAVTVVGLTPHFASPRGTIIMSRESYARLWNDHQLTRAFVRLIPETDPAGAASAISRRLGADRGLRVLPTAALIDYFASQVRRAFAGLYVLAALVLGVVVVGMADALAAGVLERSWQIGLLRATGVRGRLVQRLVTTEAVVLGGLGLALAVAAGLALGTLWVTATFPRVFGWALALHVSATQIVLVVLATLAACLAAAWFPSRHAAGLDPVAALRND